MIKVIIVDDHQIVVEGIEAMLSSEKDIEVVKTFLRGKAALEFLKENEIDVAILDVNMPEMSGAETTKAIVDAGLSTKVLILSMYDEAPVIGELLEAGCSGYILKNKGQEELTKAIRTLKDGGEHFGSKVLAKIIAEKRRPKAKKTKIPVKLTKREIEVITLIAKEFTTPQISKQLNIAETTVDTHRRNMITKLGVKSSLGLVRYAMEMKYIS